MNRLDRVDRGEDDPAETARFLRRGPEGGAPVAGTGLLGQRDLDGLGARPLQGVEQARGARSRPGDDHRAAGQGPVGAGDPDAQRGHRPDHDHRRGAERDVRQLAQRGADHHLVLVVPRSITAVGRRRRLAAPLERVGDVGPVRHPHEDHQRPLDLGQRLPVHAAGRRVVTGRSRPSPTRRAHDG